MPQPGDGSKLECPKAPFRDRRHSPSAGTALGCRQPEPWGGWATSVLAERAGERPLSHEIPRGFYRHVAFSLCTGRSLRKRASIKAPERNRSLSRLLRWVSACSHPSMPRAPVVPPPQGSTAGVRLATVRAIAVQPPSHNSTRVSLTPSGASVLDTRSTESRLRYLSFAMSRLRPPALGERRHCVCACRAIARLNPRSGWL